MYMVFRSIATAVMIFVIAFFSQQLTMASVYFSGGHMDSVLLMAPSLIFVVCVSGGVDLTNYYRDAVREGGLAGAPMRAIKLGWVPCLLSAATTSLGVVSLIASHLVPIQKFGIYASILVMVATGVLFLLLPSFLEQWPARCWAASLKEDTETGWPDRVWQTLATVVTRAYVPILLVALVCTIFGSWFSLQAQCTARIHDMFSPQSRVLQDYTWLESNIGPLVPIEVVVKLPANAGPIKSYETPTLNRLQVVRKVEEAVRGVEGIDAAISALTFAPSLPRGKVSGVQAFQRARAKALDRHLALHLSDFVSLGYLSLVDTSGKSNTQGVASPGEQWWRITGRVSAGKRVNYETVLKDVERQVNAVLASTKSARIPDRRPCSPAAFRWCRRPRSRC